MAASWLKRAPLAVWNYLRQNGRNNLKLTGASKDAERNTVWLGSVCAAADIAILVAVRHPRAVACQAAC